MKLVPLVAVCLSITAAIVSFSVPPIAADLVDEGASAEPSQAASKTEPPAANQKARAKKKAKRADKPTTNPQDAKNTTIDAPAPKVDEDFEKFAIYEKTAPRPGKAQPIATALPLPLKKGDRVALIGNTLFEWSQDFGHFEALLQQQFPQHELVVRHLAWSADTIDMQPRPANFADTDQHFAHEQNSGWFRFEPRTQRLISFGTYSSTNPWGVTFDDWGQHMASHPVYAAAFHSLDPPYPQQHAAPKGLRAYSGVCGHEFVDFATFPDELRGGFIKVRYKPTNRVEIHKWSEGPFGYDEEYVGDLLFSTNLSFIPVDLQFGPRGDLFVCDWYNPVKGHMQYSLRDERRDRHSGRIWRITTKGRPTQDPPKIAGASIDELLELLKRPEYRVRFWAKRERRERDSTAVQTALNAWVARLDPTDPRHRHHQLEAVWTYRWIGVVGMDNRRMDALVRPNQEIKARTDEDVHPTNATATNLLRELLACDDHHARAAATQQLRYWHPHLVGQASSLPTHTRAGSVRHDDEAIALLRKSANDPNAIVRMEAAIAASYIGTKPAFEALLDTLKHPREGAVGYAITCALGSHTLRPHWEGNTQYNIARLLKQAAKENVIKEPAPNANEAQFDSQSNLKLVNISCVPERMLFTVKDFVAAPGQPVKFLSCDSRHPMSRVFIRLSARSPATGS